MFGVDSDIGASALRLWIAAGSAALLVFICALAFDWTRGRAAARIGIVVLGAAVAAFLASAFLDAVSVRDQSAERRALEMRASELGLQSLAPGSPLACLDGLEGESIEAACEKALFATPATVASATSYVAARLALLSDLTAYAKHGGTDIDSVLSPLRRALEADRFGFVGHVLAVRDGCGSADCKALALLRDPSRVRANLSDGTLDRYLDRYASAWAQSTAGASVADTTSSPQQPANSVAAAPAAAAAQGGPPGSRKVTVDFDFPSAASIPPVSIMNPEPKGPVTPAAAAAAVAAGAASADPNAQPSTPPKRSRKQAGGAAAPAAPPPPSAPPVDPVWTPGATLATPQPAAAPARPTQPQATATGPGGTQ